MCIEVTSFALAAMRAAAVEAYPNEACGILLGEGKRVKALRLVANVHPTPQTHFEIDPQALIDAHRDERAGGAKLIGYFHSHPTGDPRPSETDRASSAGDGRIWAICGARADGVSDGGDTLRFWEDGAKEAGSGFNALSYCVID